MKVTKNTQISLDNKEYLLEEGDEIIIDEGLVSNAAKGVARLGIRAMLGIISKIIPINKFKKYSPEFRSVIANISKNPEKAEKLQEAYGKDPGLFDILGS